MKPARFDFSYLYGWRKADNYYRTGTQNPKEAREYANTHKRERGGKKITQDNPDQ